MEYFHTAKKKVSGRFSYSSADYFVFEVADMFYSFINNMNFVMKKMEFIDSQNK